MENTNKIDTQNTTFTDRSSPATTPTTNDGKKFNIMIFLTPINGISALTKLFSATLFSTPLRGRKPHKIISNLLKIQNIYTKLLSKIKI
jgi:hypothetical protein